MFTICPFQIHLPSCLMPQQSHMDTSVSPVSSDFDLLGVMGLLAENLIVGTGKVRVFICLVSFLVGYHMLSLSLLYTPAIQGL